MLIPKKKRSFRQKQFIATRQAGATFTAPASSPHDTAHPQLTAFPRVKKLFHASVDAYWALLWRSLHEKDDLTTTMTFLREALLQAQKLCPFVDVLI